MTTERESYGRGVFACREIIRKLLNEYANTPLDDRKNGWSWLVKADEAMQELKG